MLKRFDRYVFNSLKVAITGMCWYALFAIPYEKIFEASIAVKVIWTACLEHMGLHDDDCGTER